MTKQELNKKATIKTMDRLIKELDDYFDDFSEMSTNPDKTFNENYLASQSQAVCREAMSRLREIKEEYQ